MELPLPEIDTSLHAGLVPSGCCPVSGRTFWTRPQWHTDHGHYQNQILILAPDLVVSRTRGFTRGEDTQAFLLRLDMVVQEFGSGGSKLCFLQDWTGMTGSEALARRIYVSYFLQKADSFRGLSFFGLNATTRMLVKVVRQLETFPFPLETSEDYPDALAKALKILGAERRQSSIRRDKPRRVPALPVPDFLLRNSARRLEEIFGAIPWDRNEESVNPLPPSDPFHGLVAGWLSIKAGLDDLHNRNDRLERSFRAILESAREGVWIADHSGKTTWSNGTMSRLMHVSSEEMAQLRLFDALPSAIVREAHSTALPACELRLQRPDGTAVWVLASTGPVPPDMDGTGGIYAIFTDITRRRESESEVRRLNAVLEKRVEERTAELAATNQKLAESLKGREDFLAAMSHELRTPLSTILNTAESLRIGIHGDLTSRQEERLAILEKNGRHLQSLIDDVLDLSKSLVGPFPLGLEPIDLADLARQCLASVGETSRMRGLEVVPEIPAAPVVVEADPVRIRQILLNLLSNALKFGPRGTSIGLRLAPRPEEERVDIEVWDEGPGISESDRKRLFEPFVQLDTRVAREHGGAGLGLALSRRLAEAHGGTIEIECGPERGSLFRVVLPCAKLDLSPTSRIRKSQAIPRTESGGRVLLVEDNPDLRLTLSEYLEGSGWSVRACAGGREALDAFRESPFEIVLMDIQMPGMDGLEAIRRIRKMGSGPTARIIAVSGLAFPEDRERSLQAGADLHLAKPVKLRDLSEALTDSD